MSDKIYWVWLQQVLGISASIKSDEIVSYFGNAKNVYHAGGYEWRLSNVFTPRQVGKLDSPDLNSAQAIVDRCAQNGWKIVAPDDKDYPSMLFNLPNFPLVLYVDGNLDCLKNKISIAMVGTRNPNMHSVEIARSLAASVSRSGAVVVSGGAKGIDSACHQGALDAGQKTVAVLGCGFNARYPYPDPALRSEIVKSGAVVSEYPPDVQPRPAFFPVRNRIISGMSYGTVVIEANERSGSLITANYALEQGREIFAVPGDVLSSGFSGANKLIRDGATPVFTASDILEEYAFRFPELLDFEKIENQLAPKSSANQPKPPAKPAEKPFVKTQAPGFLSENARKVYSTFERQTEQADEIILKCGLDAGGFSSAMTELELCGFVELLAGKNYKLLK